jgi:gluconokinase
VLEIGYYYFSISRFFYLIFVELFRIWVDPISMEMARVVIIMGVSGSGKTSIGKAAANLLLATDFLDADDLHPPANIAKMKSGQPLNDDDRHEWLLRLNHLIHSRINSSNKTILACSALKAEYRKKTVCFFEILKYEG